MIYFLLIFILFLWLLMSLFQWWRYKKILAPDFPLFLLCSILISSTISLNIPLGEYRQISINIVWIPILYWLHLRKPDINFMFRGRLINLITGFIIGIVSGGTVVLILSLARISNQGETLTWIPGSIFYSIQMSITEEFVFRCLFMNYLRKHINNESLVNLLQGLIFGIFHIGKYWQHPVLLFLPIGSGLLYGLAVLKQKSIYGSMIAHILHNLIVMNYSF